MITKNQLDEVFGDFTVSIAGSMKADDTSNEQKSFTLRIHMDGVKLRDALTKACGAVKITWVNSVGRKSFDKITAGQTFDVNFGSPATKVETDEEKLEKAMQLLQGLPQEMRDEYLTKIEAMKKE